MYGQLGYVQRSVNVDDLTVSVPGLDVSLADLGADEGGYEIEAGVRGEVLPRLELTGAVKLSDVGAVGALLEADVSIPEEASFNDLELEDAVIWEAGFLYDLWGPIAVRGAYELGDAETAFIGLRSQF